MVLSGEVEVLVGGEQTLISSPSGSDGGGELGESSGSEVPERAASRKISVCSTSTEREKKSQGRSSPVVGSFTPSSVLVNGSETVCLRVGDRSSEDLGSDSSSIVRLNGESSDGASSVDDTVPVSVHSRPPGVRSAGCSVGSVAVVESVGDDGVSKSSSLGVGESLMTEMVEGRERKKRRGRRRGEKSASRSPFVDSVVAAIERDVDSPSYIQS